MKTQEIPMWEKYTLTIEEAAIYFHIGEKRLRAMVLEQPNADFYFRNGNRVLIKRRLFEQYMDQAEAV